MLVMWLKWFFSVEEAARICKGTELVNAKEVIVTILAVTTSSDDEM